MKVYSPCLNCDAVKLVCLASCNCGCHHAFSFDQSWNAWVPDPEPVVFTALPLLISAGWRP